MAVNSKIPSVSRRLHFRILAPLIPIVLLMVLLSGIVLSVGLKTVSHFVDERILLDLQRSAREIYNLCDTEMQGMLLNSSSSLEISEKITRAMALGKIQDYAIQNDVQAIVYTADKILLGEDIAAGLELKLADLGKGRLLELQHAGKSVYAYRSSFDLWDWHFLLFKEGAYYEDFIAKIGTGYLGIGGVFLLVTLLLIAYFRRVVHQPVNAIIHAIQTTGTPDYKGIYEFEFLSNVIAEAREKEQQKQQQISYQASHDSLTGLLNRLAFENRLEELLKKPVMPGTRHTLLYLDLDQFKIVNDTCGHQAGDVLLRHVTGLMQSKVRHSDVLARLGGDEFGLLLENCDGDHAYRIADSLRQTIREFRFVWSDRSFTIGVSTGLVSFGEDESTLSDILRIADGACYVAKEKGRDRIHVYRPGDGDLKERQGQMNWIGRISKAFEEDRLLLYRQLIIPLQETGQSTMRYEFLIRMLGEDGEIIPPQAFLPAAERYNVIPSIDFWVIRKVFELYERDCRQRKSPYTCAINLSGVTLGDDRLLPYISELFDRFDIPPNDICFEITETTAIANMVTARDLIASLKQMGCQFALDDFGSGMASFGYLKGLDVDYIKIDGSFITDFLRDPLDQAVVEAINNIGHVMGVRIVAEHVDDPLLLQALRDIGVDYAQGFGIARPEPVFMPEPIRFVPLPQRMGA